MSFLTLRVLLFTAECLLASILLPLLAFAVTRLVRRAALRHLVWLTAFGVLAVLPAVALLLPARQIVLPVAAPIVAPAEMMAAPPSIASPGMTVAPMEMDAVPILPAPIPAAPVLSTPVMPMPVVAASEPLLTVENALLLLVLIWTAGLLWHLGRMTLGGIGLMRLRRQGEIFGIPNAPCELLVSPLVSGPSTFGLFRPVILLPQGARDWNQARLAAVLAHEAAHVRRRDTLNQFVVRLVCAIYWFNPLLWLAARALRREAELAADDAALASGLVPSSYAAELVALAAETRRPAPGVAMADSALAARVQAALATNISRKGVSSMDIARMASLGLAATLLLGTARLDLAMAQEAPVNPAPAARPAPAAPPANRAPVARPAPAAPPARSASPTIDIEVNRDLERKVDIEVEALKSQADALAAKARARAEAEKNPARRAQYAQEAARVAAESAKVKAEADRMAAQSRLRMTAWRISMAEQQVREAAEQQMRESQQRAREAAQMALEAKARADENQRRMEGEKQSLLAPFSDDEKTLLAARQQKLTVSPQEVDEWVRSHAAPANLTFQQREALRERAIVELAREKLAALQNADAAMTAADRFPISGGTPIRTYRVSEIFLAVDRPENDARVKAEMEAIEKQIRVGESFRGLAQQYSRSPSAAQGGDIGWVHDGQLDPEINSVVAGLKRGELSHPVRGKGGWYLLGLQDRQEGAGAAD